MSVCCDSDILFFTQKFRGPASSTVEIRMWIGTHVYYVQGMVCRPCVIMMHSNSLVFFWLVHFFLVWRINPFCKWYEERMSPDRETHEYRGHYDGTNICSCCFLVFSHWTLLQLDWSIKKTAVLTKLYYVRFADENDGGSVVEMFTKQEYLASRTVNGPPTKRVGGFGVLWNHIYICWELRRQRLSWRDLTVEVVFELLVCVEVYSTISMIVWPWIYGGGWKSILRSSNY